MGHYYPAMLDLRHKPTIVIGGGTVAERKIEALLSSQAMVIVVSPRVTERIKELRDQGKLELLEREYSTGDLIGHFLIILATDHQDVNRRIYADVNHSSQLVNIVDSPELCTFIVPALVDRGHLQIAISTSGASPGLAKKIRLELEQKYGVEYREYTAFLADMRKWILNQHVDQQKRRILFAKLLEDGVLQGIMNGERTRIEEEFKKLV